MTQDEINTKQKIYQATLELIISGKDPGRITTRQIAVKAGVNLALVNYYYQSKENLLSQVVGTMMGSIISQTIQNDGIQTDAKSRLRNILITTADAAFRHYNLCKIALSIELKNGCKNSCDMVMPLLKEIFKGYSESDLNMIALQLMLPFHHFFLEPEIYNVYLNTDFFDEKQRRQKINQMIDCILAGFAHDIEKGGLQNGEKYSGGVCI
ncbi:MAG: TetR/AcrR family transcriptional regulator [Actinobacteria bacterium]|nr:TetR/AcrR family transcriptional regulator [Actinomycetota bacterium]